MIRLSLIRHLTAVVIATATLACPARAASSLADGFAIESNGNMAWHGITFYAAHFSPDWKRLSQQQQQRTAGFPKTDGNSWTSEGLLRASWTADSPILLRQQVTGEGGNTLQLAYEATSEKGTPTQEMFLQVEIPISIGAGKAVVLNGTAHTLPKQFGTSRLFTQGKPQPTTLVIPAASGTLTIKGSFSLMAQDQREWNQNVYALRLRFSPERRDMREAQLRLSVTYTPFVSSPVSLHKAANFGLRDQVAGDKQGGWTDQGRDNDISALPSGPLSSGGINFEIIDADANEGRAAIVLGRTADSAYLPSSVTIDVPEHPVWKNIYVLHAAAWLPAKGKRLGELTATYEDGSTSSYEIISGEDVGNWWSPLPLSNGIIGWSGENSSSKIGLYASRFALEDKALHSITLTSAGTSMWMVPAISGSEEDIVLLTENTPWAVQPGAEWAAHEHEIEIEAGSVFDFSRLLDAPAGKHGAVIITPEGQFAFADRPDERVRFWGVNLCFSANYLEKEDADRLAKRLARSGYNTIRIHHYDRQLGLKGGKSYELDPDQLDKLDYLFAAMKREGLYVSLDLYTSRSFNVEELAELGFPEDAIQNVAAGDFHWRFKAALPLLENGFETWAAFASNLLNHKNPYTGLTWKEDPALIGICPVNEDSPAGRIDSDPFVRELFQNAFAKWWENPANRELVNNDRDTGFNWFIYEAHRNLDAKIYAFLKEEMGVTTPLTGSNFLNVQSLAFARDNYDFVDNHIYWDHPNFPEQRWKLPFRFNQGNATRQAAPVPRSMMPTRIIGKPFSVTEFNFVRPNSYRAEGGVLMPAYASLQDWDSIHNFDYSSSSFGVRQPSVGGTFSIVADPIGMIADRLSSVLFLRGDIQPSEGLIGFEVHPQSAFTTRMRSFPENFNRLGLVTRIGSGVSKDGAPVFTANQTAAVIVNPEDSARNPAAYKADTNLFSRLKQEGVIADNSIDETNGIYRSDTGQIELNAPQGTIKVVTDLSELFVLPARAALEGSFAQVRGGDTFATVSILSADDLPLAQSSRLLITHLTNALPSGMAFADNQARMMTNAGKLPHLLQRGTAEILLQLEPDAQWQAWAVSPSGRRLHEVPLQKTDAGWLLNAKTIADGTTRMAYEIIRN